MDKEVKWIKRNKHWNKHVGKKNTGLNIRTEATQNSEEKKNKLVLMNHQNRTRETKWTPEINNKMEQENQNEHQKIKNKKKAKKEPKRPPENKNKTKRNEHLKNKQSAKRTPEQNEQRKRNTPTAPAAPHPSHSSQPYSRSFPYNNIRILTPSVHNPKTRL